MTARSRSGVRRAPKPKSLLDEGLPPRRDLPQLNQYCDVKHIKLDLRRGGATDAEVYRLASVEGRLVVTFNIKDFKPRITRNGASVIGVSTGLTARQIDAKLASLVKQLSEKDFRGQYFSITGETRRKGRRRV